MRPSDPRPPTAGPASGPAPPFPLKLNGKVVKGFGRGSKELPRLITASAPPPLQLGIPTANIPLAGLSVGGHEDVDSGVYFGWAGLNVDEQGRRIGEEEESKEGKEHEGGDGEEKEKSKGVVYPMVMSIGWNPFYKNTVRSVEVHILHAFPTDFYAAHMNLLILGFIRPEYDYVSKESLIEDIREDIEVARRSLEREPYRAGRADGYLMAFGGEGHEGDVGS